MQCKANISREQFDNIVNSNKSININKLEYIGLGNESSVFSDGEYVYKIFRRGFVSLDVMFAYTNLVLKANELLDLSPDTEFVGCHKVGLKYIPCYKLKFFKNQHVNLKLAEEALDRQGWLHGNIDLTHWLILKNGITFLLTDMVFQNAAFDENGLLKVIDARHIASTTKPMNIFLKGLDTSELYKEIESLVKNPHNAPRNFYLAPLDVKYKKSKTEILNSNKIKNICKLGFTKCIDNIKN